MRNNLAIWKDNLKGREGRRRVLHVSRTNASWRFLHFPFFALGSFIPVLFFLTPLPSPPPPPLNWPVLQKKGQTGLAKKELFRLGIVLKGQACVARAK